MLFNLFVVAEAVAEKARVFFPQDCINLRVRLGSPNGAPCTRKNTLAYFSNDEDKKFYSTDTRITVNLLITCKWVICELVQ